MSDKIGWSNSRILLLDSCERKYYYQYFTRFLPDDVKWDFFLLKNLRTLNLYAGDIIHEEIATILKNDEIIEYDFYKKNSLPEIKIKVDKFIKRSSSRQYDHYDYENKDGLIEYFKEEIDDDDDLVYRELFNFIHLSVKSFLNSNIYKRIIESHSKGLQNYTEDITKDKWQQMKYFHKDYSDCTLWLAPDFWFEREKGKYVILDWKSGRSFFNDEISDQLKGYAFRLKNELNNNFESIEVYNVILPEGELYGGKLTIDDIDNFEKKLNEDIKRIKNLYEEDFTSKLIPRSLDSFEKTNENYRCKICKFDGICD